jgi:glycosyltransferase involved in cell wall biosynthesis
MLRKFANDHEVYLAAFSEIENRDQETTDQLSFCRRIVTVSPKPITMLPIIANFAAWPLNRAPLELALSYSSELAAKIGYLIEEVNFDIIQIEHGSMGLYLHAVPSKLRKRAVWVLHDIDYEKFRRISRIEKNFFRKLRARVHSIMMRTWEPKWAELFGLCVTMTEVDKQILRRFNERLRVEVSPSGVDTCLYRPLPEEDTLAALLYVGSMSYQPNIDAVNYFCRDILPRIRKEFGRVEFWIVGKSPVSSVMQLRGDGVYVTGAVPDVIPYYRRSKVCVIPLRAGSGIRMKILESMALGRPVVSTSLGAEGLDVIDGKHIIIANDSASFAQRTIELLKDPKLRKRLADEARRKVVVSYDWDVIARKLLTVFEGMA